MLVKPTAGADGAQTLALCWSEGRTLKDRAIRERAQARFLADIENLQRCIASGRLRQEAKIHEAIGRLEERYSRVARLLPDPLRTGHRPPVLARRSGA